MSVCLSVCLYVSLPFCLSVSLYVFLSVCLSVLISAISHQQANMQCLCSCKRFRFLAFWLGDFFCLPWKDREILILLWAGGSETEILVVHAEVQINVEAHILLSQCSVLVISRSWLVMLTWSQIFIQDIWVSNYAGGGQETDNLTSSQHNSQSLSALGPKVSCTMQQGMKDRKKLYCLVETWTEFIDNCRQTLS